MLVIFEKNSFILSFGPDEKSTIMINAKICASFTKIHSGITSNFDLYMLGILHTNIHILFTI